MKQLQCSKDSKHFEMNLDTITFCVSIYSDPKPPKITLDTETKFSISIYPEEKENTVAGAGCALKYTPSEPPLEPLSEPEPVPISAEIMSILQETLHKLPIDYDENITYPPRLDDPLYEIINMRNTPDLQEYIIRLIASKPTNSWCYHQFCWRSFESPFDLKDFLECLYEAGRNYIKNYSYGIKYIFMQLFGIKEKDFSWHQETTFEKHTFIVQPLNLQETFTMLLNPNQVIDMFSKFVDIWKKLSSLVDDRTQEDKAREFMCSPSFLSLTRQMLGFIALAADL